MAYFGLPIVADAGTLAARMKERLAALVPGWRADPTSWDSIEIDEYAGMAAEAVEIAAAWDEAAFTRLGSIFGIPRVEASYATGETTWTFYDDAGALIEAGTEITLLAADGFSRVGFRVVQDVVVPPGVTATEPGQVQIAAVEPGADGSGLALDAQPEQALSRLQLIEVVGATSGGVDGDTPERALARLVEEFQLQAVTLTRPEDYETAARRVPGCARCTVVAGYDPDTGTFGHEGIFCAFPVDEAGEDVPETVKSLIRAEYAKRQIVNLTGKVADPVRTVVDVAYEVVAWEDFDKEAVREGIESALRDLLSPARHGSRQFGHLLDMVADPVVRWEDVHNAIKNVLGVRLLPVLTLNGQASGVNVALGSPVGLPRAGTITGIVS